MKIHCRFIILAVILIIAAFIFAGCKSHRSGYKHELAMDYITETLDLNDNQQKELASIKADIMVEVEKIRENKKSMRDTLKAELIKDQMDQTIINDLISDHREQMNSVVDLFVGRFVEFHSQLSQDQKSKLVAKLEKFDRWHK